MEVHKDFPSVYCRDASSWRNWLKKNHKSISAVWLIFYKKNSSTPSVTYDEAVNEALCFGWIDSKPNKRDDESYYRYFSKRNPLSNWSKINKEKVKVLLDLGKMESAGLEMVEVAQENGTWDVLNEVEQLIVPEDLQAEFNKYSHAQNNWELFPRSVKKSILEWILNAKRSETRSKRIAEAASLADMNERANQYH